MELQNVVFKYVTILKHSFMQGLLPLVIFELKIIITVGEILQITHASLARIARIYRAPRHTLLPMITLM